METTAAVPKEVLEKTTRCVHMFSCLHSRMCGSKPLCEVVMPAAEEVLFLVTRDSAGCAYRVPFGYGQVCTCPVHYALERAKDDPFDGGADDPVPPPKAILSGTLSLF